MTPTPQVLTSATLAELLVARGMIGPAQRDWALTAQARSGSTLSSVLIASGLVQRDDIDQVLAEQYGVPFIDLTAQSLDQGLLARLDPQQLVREDWVPVGVLADGSVLVAGQQEPRPALLASIARALDRPVTYQVTTDGDIRCALQHGLREVILDQTVTGLWQRSGARSARQALYAQRRVALLAALTAMIAAIALWPAGTLQTAAVALVAGFLFVTRPSSWSPWRSWSSWRSRSATDAAGLSK